MSDVGLLIPYSGVTENPPKHGNVKTWVIFASRARRNSFHG
jgi:hypothetical protein